MYSPDRYHKEWWSFIIFLSMILIFIFDLIYFWILLLPQLLNLNFFCIHLTFFLTYFHPLYCLFADITSIFSFNLYLLRSFIFFQLLHLYYLLYLSSKAIISEFNLNQDFYQYYQLEDLLIHSNTDLMLMIDWQNFK